MGNNRIVSAARGFGGTVVRVHQAACGPVADNRAAGVRISHGRAPLDQGIRIPCHPADQASRAPGARDIHARQPHVFNHRAFADVAKQADIVSAGAING